MRPAIEPMQIEHFSFYNELQHYNE